MSRDMPLVTVVLPVYNGLKTLEVAIKSILQQNYKIWELLIIDDGSIDGSLALAKSFQDSRISVLSDGLQRGLAVRLNEGIALANGKYIARMDADDICFPERFLRQVEFLEHHPEIDLLGTRAVVFRNDGSAVGLLPYAKDHEAICARPWNNFPLAHPTWMGRREWFRKYGYRMPEFFRAEDQELLLRSHRFSRFACLPEVLLAYRQGPFAFRRTFQGRLSLLNAQKEYFLRQGNFKAVLCSLCVFALKVFVDILAAFPKFDILYFIRMSASPDERTLRTLSKLLSQDLMIEGTVSSNTNQ